MKYIVFALCFFVVSAAAYAQNTSPFFHGSYQELQAAAQAKNRPYFIYFYANWCMPCKKMNEVTFRDASLLRYMQQNYLAMSFDGESQITEGRTLAREYEIYFFPMIAIFAPDGRLLEKIDGYLSPALLLRALQRNQDTKAAPGMTLRNFYDDPPGNSVLVPHGKGLYKFYFEKQPSEGFGVQVGLFESYESVLAKVEELQSNHHRNIILHMDESNNKLVFRVILGAFNSHRAATTYNELLLMKEGKNGVVVNLAELN